LDFKFKLIFNVYLGLSIIHSSRGHFMKLHLIKRLIWMSSWSHRIFLIHTIFCCYIRLLKGLNHWFFDESCFSWKWWRTLILLIDYFLLLKIFLTSLFIFFFKLQISLILYIYTTYWCSFTLIYLWMLVNFIRIRKSSWEICSISVPFHSRTMFSHLDTRRKPMTY
jgi:hypothetical protein